MFSMNSLCEGLLVKEWIDIIMLEWIKNVFNKFNEKVVIVNSIV